MFDRNKPEILATIATVTVIVLGLYLSSRYSYLFFHSLIEISTISIGLTLFILAWNARPFLPNDYPKVLGISYAFIAFIDLMHTLAYKGMNVFPGYDANLPTQLWIAARFLQAAALCAAPMFVRRKANEYALLGICLVVVGVVMVLVFSGNFPDCYIEGQGLTPFKIAAEYVIVAMLLVALLLFHQTRKNFDDRVYALIAASIVCTIISELSFTAYISVYGAANMVGHFAKLAAFYFIYRALLVTGIKEPFNLIFRDLRQTEAALVKARDTLEERVKERTAELRISEAKYRELIQKVRAAIVVHSPDTRILTSNLVAQQLLGLNEKELQESAADSPAWHFFRDDGSAMPLEEYPVNRVLTTRRPLRNVVVGVLRPGSKDVVWALVSADPVYDVQGELIQVVVTFTDITEQRRMRQEIGRVASFPMLNPHPVMEVDLDGRVSFANPAARRLFPDLEGRGSNHPYLVDWEPLAAACLKGITDPAPREVLVGDRWYHQSMYYVPEEKRLRIYGYDVTERKQAEMMLRNLNRELLAVSGCNQALLRAEDEQALLNSVCHIIRDKAGYTIAWVGYAMHDDAKSVRPMAWAGVEDGFLESLRLTWGDTERGQGPTGIALRSGKTACIGDFVTDPQVSSWSDSAVEHGFRGGLALPLKDEAGLTFGTLTIYSAEPNAFTPDETRLLEELAGDLAFGIIVLRARNKRKTAEDAVHKLNQELEQRVAQRTAALEQANKELEAFSYTVSHDLRAPLRAIDGFSSILLEDYKGALDAEGQRYLEIVHQGALRMGQLIDDILAFSRMSRREMAIIPVDLAVLTREVFEEQRAEVPGRNTTLRLGDMPTADCDPAMIRQVMVNLISNAVKFTAPRAEAMIEVSGTAQGAENVYCVKDNGVGFDMQYVDKLFGVFQRLHSADEFEGTGIGLSIVKRIVGRHGGRVWAEGKVDEGASMYFTLPRETVERTG